MPRVDRTFFMEDAVTVARRLPGMEMVVKSGDRAGRYMITETEAYLGDGDRACHASKGRTARTEPMFLEGGHLYIYFVYGMHWMLNVVTGPADHPEAVLIRGVSHFPGPGRVTRGLGIDSSFNREDLTLSDRIWIEETGFSPELVAGPRVGIAYAGEPWVSKPWRFVIRNEKEK
ncbi:MAG: DNA-3-methyladenine glycosylase [Bacteroidales bacterium]|nr:DNA-3-methyladenine glycosylase [Bacteroidales bacterium]MDD3736070.1 DNA-3-methyladenine glycosylase [Bacteroidales bacterium]HOO66623.1 DNA-3-methyladenine glycosylase [Bacteroidales bacterium]HPE21958.1 DNA-3-methyladenine glycosylase [Bacteroidales bacterium]HPJ04533.1 DNA-3-methyladenine glycosylase [Bacteroidales bacterium]